jgi:putative FmdB family regulatory protein
MPIFEYVCRDCDNRFETIVHGAQKPECPTCKSKKLDKQLSVFALSGSASSDRTFADRSIGPCGTCGDPRGPGSCSTN